MIDNDKPELVMKPENPGYRFLIVNILMVVLPFVAAGRDSGMTVVDSVTGMALPGAYILDRNGNIAGKTSDKGVMPVLSPAAYPVTVRYMGYMENTVDSPFDGRVMMKERINELPELIVESRGKKVLHLLGYVREYSTLSTYSDTVFLFREKMVDFMIPDEEMKSYAARRTPRLLTCRSYYNFRNSEGLDSVSDSFSEHFSWSDWIGVPRGLKLPAGLRGIESGTVSVAGKYGTATEWSKNGDRVGLIVDVLADTANHSFAPDLAGFFESMDFRRLRINFVFDNVVDGEIRAADLTSMSFTIESNGRGRNLQRLFRSDGPAYVETYAELFVVDREYVTVKEARMWDKHSFRRGDVGFIVTDDVPDLPSDILYLTERVDNIDRDGIRLDKKPDKRIGCIKKRNRGILQRLKSMIGLR